MVWFRALADQLFRVGLRQSSGLNWHGVFGACLGRRAAPPPPAAGGEGEGESAGCSTEESGTPGARELSPARCPAEHGKLRKGSEAMSQAIFT